MSFAGGDPAEPRWREWANMLVAEEEIAARFPDYPPLAAHGVVIAGGGMGHCSADFAMILALGADGLRETYLQAAATAPDDPARAFHQSVAIVLEGLAAWGDRYAAFVEEQATEEPDPARQAELREMAAICRQVPRRPARTFREAVQSFWLTYLAVMLESPFGGNGPGRLDQYLWPYLEGRPRRRPHPPSTRPAS